jgi:hypothetical protein
MAPGYDDVNEEATRGSAIESLAEELRHPEATVRMAYEAELARLKTTARVKDFLVVFATRRTKDALRTS